jgi:hypothetical protein
MKKLPDVFDCLFILGAVNVLGSIYWIAGVPAAVLVLGAGLMVIALRGASNKRRRAG